MWGLPNQNVEEQEKKKLLSFATMEEKNEF